MTPVWVTILVALIGAIATVSGVILTSGAAKRREAAARESELESKRAAQAQSARERTFPMRVAVYNELHDAVADAMNDVQSAVIEGRSLDLSKRNRIGHCVHDLVLYCPEEIAALTTAVIFQLAMMVSASNPERPKNLEYLEGLDTKLRRAIRRDLGVE